MAFHAMGVHKVLGKVPLVGKLVDAPYQRMVKKVRHRVSTTMADLLVWLGTELR